MTREQHEAWRVLARAEAGVLRAYHWEQDRCGNWSHPKAPELLASYPQRDALAMTTTEKIRYGSRL